MVDLQIYLTSIVQVTSFTTFENCDTIKQVIRQDEKRLAEMNRQRMEGTPGPDKDGKKKGINEGA